MTQRVVVLGGGVAGMSAAHELVTRGFQVTVIERASLPGGKARSYLVPARPGDTGPQLPGEHGFRFFPWFYQHLPATMQHIPSLADKTVFEHLTPSSREMIARETSAPIVFPAHGLRSADDLCEMLKAFYDMMETGLTVDDMAFFSDKMWRIMTMCPARAIEEFENESWWNYVDAEHRSVPYQIYLATGLTRCLVAAQAREANVRAGGVVLSQLVFGAMDPTINIDRVLDGPTSDIWLEPWHRWLVSQGVEFQLETSITSLVCGDGAITGATVQDATGTRVVHGDLFVGAVPVEVMATWIDDAVLALDPSLAGIRTLAADVAWMNGVQFYLTEDLPVVRGHIAFIDSPWALTGISQPQFWPTYDIAKDADHTIRGIISVDLSNWDAPGLLYPRKDGKGNKTARECTPEEVANDVWAQVMAGLNGNAKALRHRARLRGQLVATVASEDEPVIRDDMRARWFVDPNVVFDPTAVHNDTPLLVNKVGSWANRPDATTKIPNFVLASDYVRTNTNLATMEGANEAARRAVNALLQHVGSDATPCEIWELPCPLFFRLARDLDCLAHDAGEVWTFEEHLVIAHEIKFSALRVSMA